MAPKLLVLVQPAGLPPNYIPIRQPEEWLGVACATCERVIDDDPRVFSIDGETRCRLCVEAKSQENGCVWCGRRPARLQDTGLRFCQPCWAIYVAYVADEVEPPHTPFRQIATDVYRIVKENQLGPEPPDAVPVVVDGDVIDYTVPLPEPPPGEDRPSGERDPGPELGADQ